MIMNSSSSILVGQSIVLPFVFLRVGFFIKEQNRNKLNLFVLAVPKKHYVEPQLIAANNRRSSCGRVVLFGVPNHWVYEIDLRCLVKEYERLVFAISTRSEDEQTAHSHVNLSANIERIGTFTVTTLLPASRILRVLEIYSYHGTYKIKAHSDLFPRKNFSALYCEPEFRENVTQSCANISQKKEKTLLNTLLFGQLFSVNAGVTYQVSLLGARSVGKTSIIAAMNDQLSKVNAIAKIDLFATNADIFTDFLARSLDNFAHGNQQACENTDEELLLLDNHFYNYKTTLIEENTGFDFNLNFAEAKSEVEGVLLNDANIAMIRDSHVVIFPIDTLALMEQRGRWHESINRTRELTDLCKHALTGNSEPKLILLAPVKCETYFHDHLAEHLVCAIEEHYAAFLNFIGQLKSIACAVVPVQTLGHVILHETIEVDDEHPRFMLAPRHDGAFYSPRNADQLWTYILTFLLAQTLRLNRLKLLLAPPNPVHESLNALLSHRKQGVEGFRIFQGHREMS